MADIHSEKVKIKYILEVTVFICGAVVMVFELVGSRVLGPYFGTSIFVWTSLIGVILGSLSLGYYLGGKIADKKASLENLSVIIFGAAIFILLTTITKDPFLASFHLSSFDTRLASFCSSVILFLPASVLMGMVSPYAVKLKMESMSTSAATVGNLYAVSTVGSILGTFLAGFYLIPYFGTNKLLIILSATLVVLSVFLSALRHIKFKLIGLAFVTVVWFGADKVDAFNKERGLFDIDTAYNRIWIHDDKEFRTGKVTRTMGINNENHSSMFIGSSDLVNEYTKYYHLASYFKPGFQKTLMFGGAGYSFPKSFLAKYPTATIDVIEIDPKVTELASKYFELKDNPRLAIHHEDGRVYLNKTKEKYDVIFGDAFTSHYSVPYQLTTIEAVKKSFDILNDDGVVILNIISAISGEKGKFLRAEYATYNSVFPRVILFPVSAPGNEEIIQNIILVALKSEKIPLQKSTDPALNEYLGHIWTKPLPKDVPVLTDDFAPVDYYVGKAV